MSAVVLLGAGTSPDPRKQFAVPKPIRSTILVPVGQAPVRAAVPLASAILPVVAEKFGADVATKSGVTGRSAGWAEPAAPWIRK